MLKAARPLRRVLMRAMKPGEMEAPVGLVRTWCWPRTAWCCVVVQWRVTAAPKGAARLLLVDDHRSRCSRLVVFYIRIQTSRASPTPRCCYDDWHAPRERCEHHAPPHEMQEGLRRCTPNARHSDFWDARDAFRRRNSMLRMQTVQRNRARGITFHR